VDEPEAEEPARYSAEILAAQVEFQEAKTRLGAFASYGVQLATPVATGDWTPLTIPGSIASGPNAERRSSLLIGN